jgi:sialate O-acetylesterase
VFAEAKIVGEETVVVSSPEVRDPVAVRYAWAANPDCNLYNSPGLPASPFRTDDWEK